MLLKSAEGLSGLTAENVSVAMQVNSSNLMAGIEGRANLLSKLATALRANSSFFGPDARPGNLLGALFYSRCNFRRQNNY